ncbi:MAG TPA: hypothetical protein VF503_12985 [Sphingobium sp.]|uniref:hypothetical protein n=1 Tax=Sphingobium sp. TaxID=1912891 RepID=UPI002ED37F4F
MQRALGISRTTLRQIARLLEGEGILKVKRGSYGGYFGCRPSLSSIEAAVTEHLGKLDVRIEELLTIASITWSEALRQAANLRNREAKVLATKLSTTVRSMDPLIAYQDLVALEKSIRSAVFGLIGSPYMQFMFKVNMSFAQQKFDEDLQMPADVDQHRTFVEAWRDAKLLELQAIILGDQDLAVLAAQRTRQAWARTIKKRQANDNLIAPQG